jgi:hypothetical protein
MTETHQRGGKAYHSVLAPHSRFHPRVAPAAQDLAGDRRPASYAEKGIRVTLYAPYHFYRRKLKRAKRPHWESETAPVESQPTRPIVPASRPGDSAPAPLPAQPAFKRPNRETFNRDEFT